MSSDVVPLASPAPSRGASEVAFARVAWGVLGYTVFVVLFGAVVRITGSGAGCGQHWPTCQGDAFVLPHGVKMVIEYSHRATSGFSFFAVLGMAVLGFRRFPSGHAVRRFAVASLVLMLVEAYIGGVLVRRALVADNVSVARALVMSLHLVNTSLLTAAIALTAWSATHRSPRSWLPSGALEWALAGALVAVLAVSVTGAVTALGDTLFPVEATRPLADRLAADYATTATFLERGRVIHPALAALVALFLLAVARRTTEARPRAAVERGARIVSALVVVQVGAGVTNIALGAPGAMQVVHLAIATTLWISLVVFYATAKTSRGTHASA